MIEDAKAISDGGTVEAEFCVVGAGAAGIPLALQLARSGARVVLVEAGGIKKAGRSQDLYQGELVDEERHLPLDSDRYRQIGGTTSLWGGRCLPFDPIDFESRPGVPHSDWPVGFEAVEKYLRRANIWCECGDYDYDSRSALPSGDQPLIAGLEDGDLVTSSIERWSPPTNFGKRYRRELGQMHNLRVIHSGVCVNLRAAKGGKRIECAEIATFAGSRFKIRARHFCLAGGGMEVTRLLLSSREDFPDGIGNHSDWLGRCYQCHLGGVVARITMNPDAEVVYGYELDHDGIYCRRRFTLSAEVQRRRKILNTHILIDRPFLVDPSHGNGLLSLAFLTKNAVGKKHLVPGKGKYGIYWAHAKNVLSGSPQILSFLPQFLRKRFLHGRRIPSLLLRSRSNSYHLFYHSEQIPNRDSRISLSEATDALGMPRLRVDYRVTETDVESVMRAHEVVADALQESGVGKLEYLSENPRGLIADQQAVLGHHIGTTRMAQSPEDGVVDADCKVHGIENLHIASSSTFPTSSQANPVLMIVAMALRLADHLLESAGR